MFLKQKKYEQSRAPLSKEPILGPELKKHIKFKKSQR